MSRPTLLSVYRHAAQRLNERYGVHITLSEYEALCTHAVHAGQEISPALYGRLLIHLRVKGTNTRAVYCPKTQVIVTFLQPGNYVRPEQQRYDQRRSTEGLRHPRHPPYKRRRA